MDHHVRFARRRRARHRASARRGLGAGDRVRVRGARAPRVRLARRAARRWTRCGRRSRSSGWRPIDLRSAELQPKGVALLRAETPQGRPLVVKVYGRDAWDGQLLTATWSYLWYRDEAPALTISRRQQVEHEAFITLLAERSGVPVLPVIAAGVAGARDGVLVLEADGRPIQELAPAEMTDALLADLWRRCPRCTRPGSRTVIWTGSACSSPGRVGADRRLPGGERQRPAAGDARRPRAPAGDDGADHRRRPWAAAALDGIGADGLTEILPYIQPAALSRSTRRSLKDAGARPGRDPGPGGGRGGDRAAQARAAPAGDGRFAC